ncbi:hypothetical protein ACPXCE_24375 [Streptomyces sp. DT24]|uniref:hypothetical protein n=1 Tax=unclassified Streptomyces TaxID=2593676 RepID=UPI003CF1CB71
MPALVLAGLWWWAVLRLVLEPGHSGLVEGAVAAGGWGLSLLPVHVATSATGRSSGTDTGAGAAESAGETERSVADRGVVGWGVIGRISAGRGVTERASVMRSVVRHVLTRHAALRVVRRAAVVLRQRSSGRRTMGLNDRAGARPISCADRGNRDSAGAFRGRT